MPSPPPPLDPNSSFIRPATPSDLETITAIAVAASALDPTFPYRYPHAAQHPHAYESYMRNRWAAALADGNPDTVIMLYCLSQSQSQQPTEDEKEEKEEEEKSVVSVPIAFAAWHFPSSSSSSSSSEKTEEKKEEKEKKKKDVNDGGGSNPAADPARIASITSSVVDLQRRVFEDVYGDQGHAHLDMLMCDPKWQRKGAGRALVVWGLDEARKRGGGGGGGGGNKYRAVTLTASSPAGVRLYERMGFEHVGGIKDRDGGEEVEIKAMAWRVVVDDDGV